MSVAEENQPIGKIKSLTQVEIPEIGIKSKMQKYARVFGYDKAKNKRKKNPFGEMGGNESGKGPIEAQRYVFLGDS